MSKKRKEKNVKMTAERKQGNMPSEEAGEQWGKSSADEMSRGETGEQWGKSSADEMPQGAAEEQSGNLTECEYPVVEIEILPEKVICPECGGLTTEGLIFCEKCGGEMEPMEPAEYERLRKEYRNLREKLRARENESVEKP